MSATNWSGCLKKWKLKYLTAIPNSNRQKWISVTEKNPSYIIKKVTKNGYGMNSYHHSCLFLFHLTYYLLVGLQGLWTNSPVFPTYSYSFS